jgi:Ca-activated chloride channel family protein
MRAYRWIGVLLAVVAAVSVKLSCAASVRIDGSTGGGGGGGTTVAVQASVVVGSGGYAAMDEIPVAGGELRLAVPLVVVVEGVQREQIGFPLKHTAITAKVAGMMAEYEIEQVFENPFDTPIEAVYVFPLGDDGAVSGYRMTIGERTITGEIRTRDDARRVYDQARAQGHTAGLVEQQKPNVFTQHVANIAPRETVKIKLTYVELLEYADGAYDLVVPLVVGPRYLPAARDRTPVAARPAGAPGEPGVTAIPYVDATRASSTVSFTAEIDAGVPIAGLTSPSHDLAVTAVSPTRSRVTLGRGDEIPNRDLIVRYRTAGPATQVGVLAHRTGSDGYFLLAIQPKAQYRTGDIAGREVLIVIDRSGSMDGAPLAQAKAVASGIIGTLTERDAFDVIGFASGVESMAGRLIPGDAAGRQRGLDHLRRMQAGGGTEMERGVVGMLTATPGHDRVRIVYFLTDGFIGNDDVVVGAAKKLLGANRIFTVGIGSAPNRSLLDRLARVGRGHASYLTLSESPQELARALVLRSAYPYLTDVRVDWGGLEVRDVTPAAIPDVYAGQPLVITGRYREPGAARIQIEGRTAGRRVTIPIELTLPSHHDLEPVASLWARRQIEALMASRDERDVQPEVTELGLAFHLVTEFTSFVAVDRSRVVGDGRPAVVEQPSIVPEGVSPETSVSYASSPSSYSPPPPPSPSSSGRSGGGGSFGRWASGGPSDLPLAALAALALLGALWVVARRLV